jgi:hypothetical protein
VPRGRSRRSTGPRPRVRGQEAPGRNSRFGIAPRRCRSAFVIPWRLRRNRRAARGAHRPDAPEGNDRQHDPTEPVVNPSRRRRDCRPQFRGQPYRSGAAPRISLKQRRCRSDPVNDPGIFAQPQVPVTAKRVRHPQAGSPAGCGRRTSPGTAPTRRSGPAGAVDLAQHAHEPGQSVRRGSIADGRPSSHSKVTPGTR